MNDVQKLVVVVLAVLIGLLGLGMSLCGGAFLPFAFGPGDAHEQLSLTLLTVGSLVSGMMLMYSTYRVFKGVSIEERRGDVSKWLVISILVTAGAGVLAMIVFGGFRPIG